MIVVFPNYTHLDFVKDKSADKPAHPGSLISAFNIRFLESIISNLVQSEISIFWLVSVARLTGLSLFVRNHKNRLSRV